MSNRLGRGLEALINTGTDSRDRSTKIANIKVDFIKRNRNQPRKLFDEEKLQELASSIKENGLIQPIIVIKIDEENYELVAGERRLQASRIAGLTEIPAVVKSLSEKEQLQHAIVENIQRENLNPVEEAHAYQQLQHDFSLTQIEISSIMGKDRVTIANTLRLLKLQESIQNMVLNGKITAGHARAILQVAEPLQAAFAEYIEKNNLSVRKAETMAKTYGLDAEPVPEKEEDESITQIREDLIKFFKTEVEIKGKKKKGKIIISYNTEAELHKIINLINYG